MNRLEVNDLHKSYGATPALAGVSIRAAAGEMVALLGRNGAGKTTLTAIVAGSRHPDSGQVVIDGVDVHQDPGTAQRWIGYAPQATGVYEPLTGMDNLRFFGELAGMGGRELNLRIIELVELFEMGSFVGRRVSAMSGGERRRVHTAAALLHAPRVLLLDEPTVGADIEARGAILDVVASLADSGTTVIYTTHYLHEVEELGARVVILDHGSILAEGEQRELIETHGVPMVELTFDGPAPQVRSKHAAVERDGDTLRIRSSEAPAMAARLIARMGPDAVRLVSMESVTATLEAVFLTLTGERFDRRADGRAELVP